MKINSSKRWTAITASFAIGLIMAGPGLKVALAETLGRELLTNGNAENNDGWAGVPIGSATVPEVDISKAEKHSGQASAHGVIVRRPDEWPAVRSAAYATETGKTYRIDFWMKVVKGPVGVSMRNGANNDYSNFYSHYMSAPEWTEYTAYYNEKKGGAGAYLFFSAAGSDAEFYLDDVSIREVNNSSEAVRHEWQKLFPGKEYVCWQKSSPWSSLKQLQSPTEGVRECSTVSAVLGRNEYETASFVLTNLGDKERNFQISTAGARLPVTVRHGFWVTASNGNAVDDALPLLEGKLAIPAGESREVWLTLRSQGQKAGTYNSKIQITSDGLPARSLDLGARVYPVTLPEDKPIYTLYWDYTVASWFKPAKARAFAEDLKSHYANVATAHPWSVPRLQVDAAGKLIEDYKELDSTLDNYKAMNPKMVLFCWNRDNYFEKQGWKQKPTDNAALAPYMSEAWKVTFKQWLTNWVQHMKEKGYGYDSFAMCPDDETINPAAAEMDKLIKETDPRVKIFVNSFGTSLAEAQAMAPYADIFCPFLHDYLSEAPYNSPDSVKLKPLSTKLLKKSDKFFWTYSNPLGTEPQEAPPYKEYRLAVWRAWSQGMGGFGYWVYSYKGHWNSYNNPDAPNWAVVYQADDADAPAGLSKKELIVPGKRWEATREGVEDYCYLAMLKNALAKPGKNASRAALTEGRKLLSDLPTSVLAAPQNDKLADNGKESVLKVLAKLGK